MRSHFKKVVQNFKLKMIGGALKGNQLTPLLQIHVNMSTHLLL